MYVTFASYKKYKVMGKPKYKLKSLMEANNISYNAVAEQCSVSLMTVYNWTKIDKKSKKSISSDNLLKIALMLQISMESIYND